MDVGSIGIAAWIARVMLVILLVQAIIERRYRLALVTAVVVLIGWIGLSRLNVWLITPFVAIVDIVLVLMVHGRDFRLN